MTSVPRHTMPGSAPPCCRGFSLVELLVVMAVLGILAMLVMPLAEVTTQRERERELRHALWEIRAAIDDYKRAVDAGLIPRATASGYPPSLETLVRPRPAATVEGKPAYFLRRIPRDPFAEPGVPGEKSWALRSYRSPPEHPAPGPDVYDVASTASGIGLNGVALRDW